MSTKEAIVWFEEGPQAWYEKIDRFFVNLGFKCCESDHSIYVLHVKGDTLIVVVYLDDLVLNGNKPNLIFILKRQLVDTFEMIDLGILHFFLDLQLLPLPNGILLS